MILASNHDCVIKNGTFAEEDEHADGKRMNTDRIIY